MQRGAAGLEQGNQFMNWHAGFLFADDAEFGDTFGPFVPIDGGLVFENGSGAPIFGRTEV